MATVRACASLDEVRSEIDRLDRAIVPLLVARFDLALQAVQFKASDADVRAPERAEQVVTNVRQLALECGAHEAAVERVYRALVAAMIHIELADRAERGKC